MKVRLGLFSSVVALLGAGCTKLDAVDTNVCGNGVIEPDIGEVCDGAPGCFGPETPLACLAYSCESTGCPAGSVCGADQVCYALTGQLTEKVSLPVGYSVLQLGDTDGDCGYGVGLGVGDQYFGCRQELVGSSFNRQAVEISFFSTDFALEQQVTLAGAFFGPPPLVANVDGETNGLTADLMPITQTGIGLYRGEPSRAFRAELLDRRTPQLAEPKPFRLDSLSFPLAPGSPLCARIPVAVIPGKGVFDLRMGNFLFGSGASDHALIHDTTGDGCDELIDAAPGGDAVTIHTPSGQPATLFLPGEDTLSSEPLVSFEDAADGGRRGVIAKVNPVVGPPKWIVAWSSQGQLVFGEAIPTGNGAPTVLLAAGDLNDDGHFDVVAENGVFACGSLANGQGMCVPIWQDPSNAITAAQVADFQGDGLPDVVLLAGGVLHFWNNAGGGSLAKTQLSKFGEHVVSFALADLDGDALKDIVALAQTGSDPATQTALLEAQVYYGRAAGPPEGAVVAAGLTPDPNQGFALFATDTEGDGFADIALFPADANGLAPGGSTGTFVSGDASRSLISNLKLPGIAPIFAVAADVDATNGASEVVVVGKCNPGPNMTCPATNALSMTILGPDGSTPPVPTLGDSPLVFSTDKLLLSDDPNARLTAFATDLDGDGVAETVAAGPVQGGTGVLLYSPNQAVCGAMPIAVPVPGCFSMLSVQGLDLLDAMSADVDGDFVPDLVLLGKPSGTPCASSALWVYKGAHRAEWLGAFDTFEPLKVDTGANATCLAPLATYLNDTFLQRVLVNGPLDPAPGCTSTFAPEALVYEVKDGTLQQGEFSGVPWGASDMAAGDLNGDGYEDVVVSYEDAFGGKTTVYLAGSSYSAPLAVDGGMK